MTGAGIRAACRELTRRINGPEFEALAGELDAFISTDGDAAATELAHCWRDLAALRTALQQAEGVLAATLAPHVRRHRLEVEGVGTFDWSPGTKRSEWDHELAQAAVFVTAIDPERGWRQVDPDTGELEEPAMALWRAVTTAARFAWRAGKKDGSSPGLRTLGLNPDDYCRTEPGAAGVRPTWADNALELVTPAPVREEPAA